MQSVISVDNLSKSYSDGFEALKSVSLEIEKGEIFALLGPNGTGKTTLINIICGIANPTSGNVLVDGHDIIRNFRATRSMIGLVPQELVTETFESVWATVRFSRGLFGKPADPILVDMKQPNLVPLLDGLVRTIVPNLVYAATGREVTHSMVAGKWLMRDRQLVNLDAIHSL